MWLRQGLSGQNVAVPELPEIVAHAERLSELLAGSVLADFRALHPAALKTFDPRPAVAVGRELRKVAHRGKYLLLDFSVASDPDADPTDGDVTDGDAIDGDSPGGASGGAHSTEVSANPGRLTFVVHLMQGGRLRPDAKQAPKPRGGMARWRFNDSTALLLTEAGREHRAGVWLVAGDPLLTQPLSRLGTDADCVSRGELTRQLAAGSERVHGFLRDQSHIAGIGRLLANEILHAARISPFAITSKLDAAAVGRLHEAIYSAVARGLAAERALDQMGRSADRPNDVHHRVGQPCPSCDDTIRSVEYRRYRVAYCPRCQTGGKVLADNTTSRFLK